MNSPFKDRNFTIGQSTIAEPINYSCVWSTYFDFCSDTDLLDGKGERKVKQAQEEGGLDIWGSWPFFLLNKFIKYWFKKKQVLTEASSFK